MKPGLLNGEAYLPLVLPMGWSWSCYLAQSLTWGVILRVMPNDVDLDVPENVNDLKIPPGHMTMKDGTTIFVIYDTILVVAISEVRTKAWGERIGRNSRLAQLDLKYEKLTSTVDFGGIQLQSGDDGTTWSVIPATVSSWKEWASSKKTSTAETLWKAMGFLRFVSPIVDLMPATLGELTEIQSVTASSAPLMCRLDYRKPRECLQPFIDKACALIKNIDYKPRHWKSHLLGMGRVWSAASDATTTCEAFVIFDGPPPQVIDNLESNEIMVREAGALADCIKRWVKISAANDILIVLCDNQPVLRSFARGWTNCSEMKTIVSDLRSILVARRIVIVDIDTNENYADIFSRPGEFFSEEERAFRLKKIPG